MLKYFFSQTNKTRNHLHVSQLQISVRPPAKTSSFFISYSTASASPQENNTGKSFTTKVNEFAKLIKEANVAGAKEYADSFSKQEIQSFGKSPLTDFVTLMVQSQELDFAEKFILDRIAEYNPKSLSACATSFISAYCKESQEKLESFLKLLQSHNVPLSKHSFNMLLQYYGGMKDAKKVEEVLLTMKNQTVERLSRMHATQMYQVALIQFAKMGEVEKARESLKEMVRIDIEKAVINDCFDSCIRHILEAYVKTNRAEEAIDFLSTTTKEHPLAKVTIEQLHIVIRALLQHKKIELALAVLNQMKEISGNPSLKPNAAMYRLFYDYYTAAKDKETAAMYSALVKNEAK